MKPWLGSAAFALTVGFGIHGGGVALAQQVQPTCDQHEGTSPCSDEAPGAALLTAERLHAETSNGDSMEALFRAIDEDRDGVISRAEWFRFSEQRTVGATGMVENDAGWGEQALPR